MTRGVNHNKRLSNKLISDLTDTQDKSIQYYKVYNNIKVFMTNYFISGLICKYLNLNCQLNPFDI